MKVILSRKGFDSANGGIFSPIFDDNTMLSLPIPSKDIDKDFIKYESLVCMGVGLDKILHDLGYKGVDICHLDPDLDISRRKQTVEGWVPAFGQINQSAKYLENCEVEEGDLFLFFGNFRHVKMKDGKYYYASENEKSVYFGKPIQVIWGYMQIGRIITEVEELKKFSWHPHSCDKRIYEEKNNTIYTAREKLTFADLPGCGLFSYDEKRVLTMPGKSKATWKKEAAYDIGNLKKGKDQTKITRKNSAKNEEGIYYAGIWQELVLEDNDISESWAKSLF